MRALEFLGGAPTLLVPDNCKTAVLHPCRYEPDLNPTYQERLVRWASTVGPFTAALIDKILQSRLYPEQEFRSCLGILRLGKNYGSDRLEAAAARACTLNACSYQSVKSILRTGLDRQSQPEPPPDRPPLQHPNIRGTDYFNSQEEPSC